MVDLPDYRHRLTFSVIVTGDGQHADGDGATATARRLQERLECDALVVEVEPGTHPVYVPAETPTDEPAPGDHSGS